MSCYNYTNSISDVSSENDKENKEVSGMLDEDIKERVKEVRRAYYKEWRKKNPDKVKAHNQNYWAKQAVKKESEATDKNENQ